MKTVKDTIDEYLKLMEESPEFFISSEVIGIIRNRVEIEDYAEAKREQRADMESAPTKKYHVANATYHATIPTRQ